MAQISNKCPYCGLLSNCDHHLFDIEGVFYLNEMDVDEDFINEIMTSQESNDSDFLNSFLYDCGAILPFRYGNCPALNHQDIDYLNSVLDFVSADNLPLVDIVQTIADGLRAISDLVIRTPYAYIIDEEGQQIDNLVPDTIRISNGRLHIGYRYRAENPVKSALIMQDYLKLFFAFTRTSTIFSEIALEGILQSLKKCVTNLDSVSKIDLQNIYNRLEYILHKIPPPKEDGQTEDNNKKGFQIIPLSFYDLRYGNYRKYVEIISTLINLRTESEVLKRIHDNILEVGLFLTIKDRKISEIKKECCLLRETVTLIEKEIFKKYGVQYQTNKFLSLMNDLYYNGKITIEAKDAANFTYSLLSWAIHSEEYCDFDAEAKSSEMYLMDALRASYNHIITGLFPEIDKSNQDK
uniref:Uncharacterized protein n=1 Tax=candidate division WOR-3 bacterium TaxID=2052148 RepID=A0A7C6EJX6_UNCW3